MADVPVMVPEPLMSEVSSTVDSFVRWLDAYGETSYDHQSFYAGVGGYAKALYYRHRTLGRAAVVPIVACEAFAPQARRLFWKPQRFPIADAHYASGFAFLAAVHRQEGHYRRAVHFLEVLIETRCPAYAEYAWGYPFDWVTLHGTLPSGTPLITTVPYVYEAFEQVYRLDGSSRWLAVMKSVAEHARTDYREYPTSPNAACCSYTPLPGDLGGVVNAAAYRAWLLTKATRDLDDSRYAEAARRNLNFVMQSQNADGSWNYSADSRAHFIDHFHTCFVLKALAKIDALTGDARCAPAIQRGVEYYVRNLFDSQRLPIPFSRRPRLTVYRRELYDYAECLNLALLLRGRFSELDSVLSATLRDLLRRWKKADGSFRSRELFVGWDNVPMHRWAQAQVFRSLAFLIHEGTRARAAHLAPTSEPQLAIAH